MERCATITMSQTYILQGYGVICPDWVQSCLHLFKSEQVNLRKVTLLKDQHPHYFSMMEIHFLLPSGEPSVTSGSAHPFLAQLQYALLQQEWQQHSLRLFSAR